MNNNAKIKNKITVRSLNILIPNFNKAFFISLILNDQETLQSPVYEAKKSKIELNYTYILNSDTVKEIKFVIYEKSTSNPIFKGQSMINDIKISEQEKCSFMYLNDNSNEWSAMIYFNIDLASENNMFDYFQNKLPSGIVSGLDLNKINNQTNDLKIEKESGFSGFFSNLIGKEKEKEKEKNTKTSSFSTTPESASHLSFLSKLAKFAKKDNFETSNSFVKNMNYPITITNILFNLFTWKNYFHTISFLFVASIMILMPDFFFVSIPIILIFLHFCYRESLSLISLKSSERLSI